MVHRTKVHASKTLWVNIAITLGLACSGCSFTFSSGPSVKLAHVKANTQLECSSSIAPPIVDTAFTATHLGGAVVGLVLPDEAFGSSTFRKVAIGADLGLAALHIASASYGYVMAGSCRRADARKNALAAEQLDKLRGKQLPGMARRDTQPKGAAGFTFGMPEVTAQRACAAAGHNWSSTGDAHVCDGTLSGFNQAKSVELKFDDRGLWSIEVTIPQARNGGAPSIKSDRG